MEKTPQKPENIQKENGGDDQALDSPHFSDSEDKASSPSVESASPTPREARARIAVNKLMETSIVDIVVLTLKFLYNQPPRLAGSSGARSGAAH